MPLYEPASSGSSTLLQTVFNEIAADTSTTSTTFVDLITQTFSTTGGALIISFSASASSITASETLNFQLLLDGSAVRGCGVRIAAAGVAEAASIVYKTAALSAASHTLKIQWSIPSSGTARIRPVGTAIEHASLLSQEVTV